MLCVCMHTCAAVLAWLTAVGSCVCSTCCRPGSCGSITVSPVCLNHWLEVTMVWACVSVSGYMYVAGAAWGHQVYLQFCPPALQRLPSSWLCSSRLISRHPHSIKTCTQHLHWETNHPSSSDNLSVLPLFVFIKHPFSVCLALHNPHVSLNASCLLKTIIIFPSLSSMHPLNYLFS